MTEEKTYSQMRQEFQEAFYKKLLPELTKYSKKNKKISLPKEVIIFGIVFTIFIGSTLTRELIGDSPLAETFFFCLKFLLFAFFIVFLFSIFKIEHVLKFHAKEQDLKKEIIPLICECYGCLHWLDYNSRSEIDTSIVSKSNLIPFFGGGFIDDVFVGNHRNVNYEIIEVGFRNKLKHYKSQTARNAFNGVIIKLDMNKNFTSNTTIYSDTNSIFIPAKLQQTFLEDIEFNQKFKVYTNDEVEARYLITPVFMEQLKDMQTVFRAKNIYCAFYNNYFLLALALDKDLFSLDASSGALINSKQYFLFYEEIVSILKLIDHFKLDQKIGL